MAHIELTATIEASSDTTSHLGVRFAVGSMIKAPPPPELRAMSTPAKQVVNHAIPLRLPNGEEVVVLRPVRRA